ncbi:MAG TPA: rod shape-determining protein RodA [bacterium]
MSSLELQSRSGWDRGLLAASAALGVVSVIVMSSAAATVNPGLALRHATWLAIGALVHVAVARTSSRRWTEASVPLYAAAVLLLLAVELVGAVRLGATRWLSVFGFSVQPSEFAKLATILFLARTLSDQPAPLSWRACGQSLAVAGVPMGLILLQPDLGSASIIGAIWLGMVWTAGVSRMLVIGAAAAALVLSPIGWLLLHDYQRTRVLVFLNPQVDPLGAGYTIIQSTIAIGSGRLFGRGWQAGTQNQLNFLPEHHSDFIFSVVGEEWGLIGCLIVIAVFVLLLARIVAVAGDTVDPQARALAAGVLSWIGYQTIVNMGMVMGLIPVVGVPLPFISYGGSSMVALWVALGWIQSIARRRSD